MRNSFAFCMLWGALLVFGTPSNSRAMPTESPALVANATNHQTEISSHAGDFYYKSNVYVYRGDVHVDNPQMRLRCELLVVEAPKLEQGKFNRATAETNVVIDWMDDKGLNHATSDKAVYTYTLTNTAAAPEERWETNAIVVLTGSPVVTNSQGVFKADPIIWDRIKDVITSTNFLNMQINQSETNTTPLFEPGAAPKTSPTHK